jgi:hypothetical protein
VKNELQVVVSQVPGRIEFNYEEIKANLAAQMELYKDIQLTEETSAEGKSDIATLRKIKKAIDDKRKEVKNDCLKPYTEFEAKAKELIGLIDEPINLIDKQVTVFEEKRKAEKKEKIRTTYNELIGSLGEYLPFDKIYDSKWENVSASMKSIKGILEEVISSTDMAVKSITDMNSEAVPKALEQYRTNLSLADAISYINRYEQQKAEILRKEEEKRKAEEERKRIAEENRLKEQERQKILEEERKRIAEENRIREEERVKAAEEAKAVEAARADELKQKPLVEEPFPTMEDDLEEAFPVEETTEEPFIAEELPFVTPGDVLIQTTFTVTGTPWDLQKIEAFLNEQGLTFERTDI